MTGDPNSACDKAEPFKSGKNKLLASTRGFTGYCDVAVSPNATIDKSPLPKSLSVPEAGRKYFGLSRNAAYAAAAAGTIPTIRVGRLLKVPVVAMERLLESAGDRGGK